MNGGRFYGQGPSNGKGRGSVGGATEVVTSLVSFPPGHSFLGYITSLAWLLRRPPRERKFPGSNPACARIFSGSSHTCD